VFGCILAGLISFSVFYQPVVVQGKSMQPTFRDGQLVWMDRQHYRFHRVREDDIVIFRRDREFYIKRVYATAGKTVKVLRSDDGAASLLETLGSPSQIRTILRVCPRLGSVDAVRVPPKCVFVVGDNVNNSLDSRDFGPISARDIVGYIPDPMAGPPRPPAPRSPVRVAHT
jgi:signal peptidase I